MLAPAVRRLLHHSGLRFVVSGGISLGVDVGSLFVLHGRLHVWLPLATALAFSVAFWMNFILNRIWTFGADDRVGRHLWRYCVLTAANLGLNVVMVTGLTMAGLPYLVSKVCVTTGLSVVNYFISRRWVFTMAAGSGPAKPRPAGPTARQNTTERPQASTHSTATAT